MLLTFLIMLLVIALGIGWGVYTNVSMYKHGAIRTRGFVRTQDMQTLSRATSVAPGDLYSAEVDAVYDSSRRYFRRALTFVFFTAVIMAFFIALLLNFFSW